MKTHQPKKTANKRLAGGIWWKLTLVALVAAISISLPQMFRAHAGGGPNAPQGSLFTVTTTDDHNDFSCDGDDCTLREAIDAANNTPTSDTIDFSVTGTINLTSALPEITDDVAIAGPGATMLTVERGPGVGLFRIFTVTNTGTVAFSGFTIRSGQATQGAGILNSSTGTVFVTDSIISDNVASSGGGILNNGTLNVTTSIISGNSAVSFGGGILNGNFATANITNGTIRGNKATNEGGGGIANFSGTVNVTDSIISDNTAGSGGGIQNFTSGAVNVGNCTISNNEAEFGGGIYNTAGPVTVTNSTIKNNEANGTASTAGSGGGIQNLNGTLDVSNSTISGNSATSGGGISNFLDFGTVNVENSTISGNAGTFGGGINNARTGTVNVTNSTISGNSASASPAFGFAGGGIANRNTGPFNVKSSIIALNSAVAGADVAGTFGSLGFNLIGRTNGSTGFTAPTDLTGTDASLLNPNLDPNGLQDNGGTTLTIALLSGSSAIDKGTRFGLIGPLLGDQRGFLRTFDDPAVTPANGGDNTDIGAFELQPLAPSPITAGAGLLINESWSPANGAIDPGERVTVNLELINTGSADTSNLVATLQSSGGLLAPSAPQSYGPIAVNSSGARDFSFTADGALISGQTITATLQLQDGAINLGTVSFNFTAGPAPCSFVRLVVTSSLSRANASTVVGAITVQNIGSVAANDVTLTNAKLGATNGTPLPQGFGTLAPGGLASVTLNFANSNPNSFSMLTAGGTYTGGTFSSTKPLTIP